MKLCNECDLNYRIRKNKRLLVELTLIQVAQLTTEGDDVSGGRGPKKTIKPVFTQPAAAQQPQVASATQVQQAPVHSSPSSVTTQAANGTTAQHPQASAAVQPEHRLLLVRLRLLRHKERELLRLPRKNEKFP